MAIAWLQTRNCAVANKERVAPGDRLDAWLAREGEALPLWLPVALGAGIVAWFLLPGPRAWIGFELSMAGLAAGAWAAGAGARRWARALLIVAVMAGIGCALIWWRAERVAAPVLARPVVTEFAALVVAIELRPALGNARLLLHPVARSDLPPQVRVSMAADAPELARLRRGAAIRLRARLMPPPRAALPGGYDFAQRAWFDRIGAVGSVLGAVTLAPGAAPDPTLRQRLSGLIQQRVAGSAGGIAAALATGDRGGIAPDDDEAMRRSGLAHLLSISGLHVTAVVGGVMWLVLRLLALVPALALRQPLRLYAAAAGALAGLGYTLLTGGEVPTVRSLAAAMLVLVALAIGREAITLRLVAAGAMFVLLLWPEALVGPSFQLSFAAVTAIVALHGAPRLASWLARRDEGLAARVGRWIGGLLLTGIAVEIALIPIALFHFHQAGLYGALANLFAIPLTTFVVMPAEALALALEPLGLAAPFWWIVQQALSAMLGLAHLVAATPGAVATLPSMPVGAFALTIIGGLWLCLWQRRHRLMGLPLIAAGLTWGSAIAPPDLLITNDGRHVATRLPDGRYALLRDRAGDYVRDQLGEAAGAEGALAPLSAAPDAACSPDFCRWTVTSGQRRWTILASRSHYRIDWQQLVDACAAADIVIADRRLPRGCTPRWLKVDRASLADTGALAIRLDPPRVMTVNSGSRGKPWAAPPLVSGRGPQPQ